MILIGKTIGYLAMGSTLPAMMIGLIKFKKINLGLKIIVANLLMSFSTDAICFVLGRYGISNLFVINLYNFFESLLIAFFFIWLLPNMKQWKWPILTLILLAFFGEIYFITGIKHYVSIFKTVESLMAITLSIYYFYRIFVDEIDIFEEKKSEFLIVVGILFYFCGAMFSFLLSSDILVSSNTGDTWFGSWIMHNISNITKNILFAIALWRAPSN